MADIYRYAVFISYSSKDAAFARKLHRALETYGIPAQLGAFDLIGGGKKNRIYPVFRDREELSAGQLGDLIAANLHASAALVVICSPNGAASPWVQKEIEHFVGLGRRKKVFAIIAEDAPVTDESGADATASCFPPAFRGNALNEAQSLEPIAADARPGKDGFRNAWLKIVAGLIGVSPGQLIDRDKARRRRRAMMIGSATALAVALTTYAIVNVGLVLQARDVLQQAQNRPSRLQGALMALDALPPPGTAFPLGWPEREAREIIARGGLDVLEEIRIDPHGAPTALAVHVDGLLVGFNNGAVQWRSAEQRVEVWRGSSRVIAVYADRNILAAATASGQLMFVDLDRDEVLTIQIPGEPRALVVDGASRRVFVGLANRDIMEWSSPNGWREVGFHREPITALELIDGALYSGALDGSVARWRIHDGYNEVIVPPQRGSDFRIQVTGLSVTADERWLAIGRRNGTLEVVDLDDLEYARRVVSIRGPMLHAVDFAPDGGALAAAYDDGVIEIWPREARSPQIVYAHDGYTLTVRYAADGRFASTGFDRTVRVWQPSLAVEAASQRERGCALISAGDMATAAFDPWLASARGSSIRPQTEQACARRGGLTLRDAQ